VDKRPGRVSVTTFIADGMEMLTVADNGEGIPPENLAKIFDPFFTTKSEGKGVGLGLAVSYGIIQAHGGDIEVKSAAEPAPPSPCRCRSSSRRRAVARPRRRWPERDEVFLRGRHAGSGPASAHGYRRAR
jgi:signal transduction histidine kinase